MTQQDLVIRAFIAAVLAPVCLALVLNFLYICCASLIEPDFVAYAGWSLGLFIEFGTLICGLTVSALGCLLIGIPVHRLLYKRQLSSLQAYLTAGIIAGAAVALVVLPVLYGIGLSTEFQGFVGLEVIAGGAFSAFVFRCVWPRDPLNDTPTQ